MKLVFSALVADRVNRAAIVSTAAIMEALKKVYGNDALVAELTGK